MGHHCDGGKSATLASAEVHRAIRSLVLGAVGRKEQSPCRLHKRTFAYIPLTNNLLNLFFIDIQREMSVAHPSRDTGLRALGQRQRIRFRRIAEGLCIPFPRLGHLGLILSKSLFFEGESPAINLLTGRFLPVETALNLLQHQNNGESVAKHMVEIDIEP